MTTGFVDTSTNMVRDVQNAIEGYDMGALRALAQEPVQNSKDAKRSSKAKIEYRLHERRSKDGWAYYLLTVTDSGTSGLIGPTLTRTQLEERGDELQDGENWAAFEGQGFTKKERQGSLGSRGQGKSAFLYHSRPNEYSLDRRERYLMLYDTVLDDGEYRLGIRYAMPADRVKEPPLFGDDARTAVASREFNVGDGTLVNLSLEPLSEIGARVIVPFLSTEAITAFRSGELMCWLQRLWWRAIQIGELEITVVDEAGISQTIEPPKWWMVEPWRTRESNVLAWKDIPIDEGLKIKRLVLLYDPEIADDEIACDSDRPQWAGVQLLRSRQWIETFDLRDRVPPQYRQGFRGFAEFERRLEQELENAEKPQHESFNGQRSAVRRIRQEIGNRVEEFAQHQGWISVAKTRDLSERDQESAIEFIRTFASVSGRKNSQTSGANNEPTLELALKWQCSLYLDYPTPTTARVNWGESIENVGITIGVDPSAGHHRATASLEISQDGAGYQTIVRSHEIEVVDGFYFAQVGSFQIIHGNASEGKIQCPEPGEYRLRAIISHRGQRVVSATRRIYVQCDPPAPPESKPHTLSVSVQNLSRPGEQRINDGDEIAILVTVTNRSTDDVTLQLDASFENIYLKGSGEISLKGVPPGDVLTRKAAVSQRLQLFNSEPSQHSGIYQVLAPGRYHVRADLQLPDGGDVLAHSSKAVFFEVDPAGPQSDLPFELRAWEDEDVHPRWELMQEMDDQWVLRYPVHYPMYQELPEQRRRGSRLSGRTSFIADICADGLLEWALDSLTSGDESRIELMKNSQPAGVDIVLWDSYCQQLDMLASSYKAERVENPRAYDLRRRQTQAVMLRMFEELS